MNFLPPLQSVPLQPKGHRNCYEAISDALAEPSELFARHVGTRNSFGANEVWGYFNGQRENIQNVYFPDVSVFSDKLRFVDLYKRPYFACYSDFLYSVAVSKIGRAPIYFSPYLVKLAHPYVLVDRYMQRCGSTHLIEGISGDSALVFLPKSTAAIRRTYSYDDLRSLVEACKQFASRVTLCVYYLDLADRLEELSRMADNIVCCGSRYDALFYFRLSALIRSHKFVAYFEPGMHAVYAAVSEKPQLLFSKPVRVSELDRYQVTRYPQEDNLTAFRDATLSLRQSSCPSMAGNLKMFVDFNASSPVARNPSRFSARPMHELMAYKFYRGIFRLADEFSRLRSKL